MALLLNGQNVKETDWDKLINELPKTALAKIDSIYQTAKSENNAELLVESVYLRTKASLRLNYGDWENVVKAIEKDAVANEDSIAKSMLYIRAAQLYNRYGAYNDRDNRIVENIKNAIAFVDALQSIGINDFEYILPENYDFKYEQSYTLFDYVNYSAISMSQYMRDTTQSKQLIDSLFNNMLDFHRRIEGKGGMVRIELAKATFLYKTYEELNHDYIRSLELLDSAYSDVPESLKILERLSALYVANINKNHRDNYPAIAITIAEKGVARFPKSEEAEDLRKLITYIQKPDVEFRIREQVYLGEQRLNVKYYNLDTLTFYLVKDTTDSAENRKKFSFILPKRLDYYDTILNIAINEYNIYRFEIEGQDAKSAKDFFVCSPFYSGTIQNKDDLNFAVRDWKSGKPIENAKVQVIFRKNAKEFKTDTVYTDKNGIAATKLVANSFYYLITGKKEPYGLKYFSNIRQIRNERPAIYTQLFTDRAMYKPGETVYFKGICYFVDNNNNKAEVDKNVSIEFYDSRSRLIGTQKAVTNCFGSFNGKFEIPKDVMNGQFHIKANNEEQYFNVEAFKAPEFEIIVDSLDKSLRIGDTVTLNGSVVALHGSPSPDTKIKYNITLTGRKSWEIYIDQSVKGEAVTDSNGRFKINFSTPKVSLHDETLFTATVKLNATDSKGETVSRDVNFIIKNDPYAINVNINKYIDKNKLYAAGVKLDYFGNAVKQLSQDLHYTINMLAPAKTISTKESEYDPEIYPDILNLVESGIFNTSDASLPISLKGYKSGAYLLTIKSDDTTVKPTQRVFYLYDVTDKTPPALAYSCVIPQKTECAVGEDIEILIGSSAKDAYMLCEIIKGNEILKREYIRLSKQMKLFKTPYLKEYDNEVRIVFSMVKDCYHFEDKVTVTKKRENKDLRIITKVFRNKITPSKQETWEFIVKDANDKPVKTEIMSVMYDRALDYIMPHQWSFNPQEYLKHQTSWWNYPTIGSYIVYSARKVIPNAPLLTDLVAENNVVSMAESPVVFVGKRKANISNLNNVANSIRKDFRSTAFFYPDLYNDSAGDFTLRFKAPDNVGSWKLMLLAHSPDMKHGYIEKIVNAVKDFSVKPNIPRFMREGDTCVLKANINNLTANALSGEATLEIFDPITEKIIIKVEQLFTVEDKSVTVASFSFTVPTGLPLAECRIYASAGDFSDGEQHLISVLPAEVVITESAPIFSAVSGTQTFKLTPATKQRINRLLTFEYTTNPVWYALMALPTLQDASTTSNAINLAAAFYANSAGAAFLHSNPKVADLIKSWNVSDNTFNSLLSRNPELKSTLPELTPWLTDAENESTQIQRLQQYLNQNQIDNAQEKLKRKLTEIQNADGSWSWFEGMCGNAFITCNVLVATARAAVGGEQMNDNNLKTMQINALKYLDNVFKTTYEQTKDKKVKINYINLIYLYTRSYFLDIPLTDVLPAHKYYLNKLKNEWGGLSEYEKALAAITLQRYGFPQYAKRILQSLREYSSSSPKTGTYWRNNRSSTYYINSAILVHTTIMEAFQEIGAKPEELEMMKTWLLRQKQTQNWGDAPSTVNAVYALLNNAATLDDTTSAATTEIYIGKHKINPKYHNAFGYIKQSFTENEITNDMMTVNIVKQNAKPSWGALYLQYTTALHNVVKTASTPLQINKTLCRNGEELSFNDTLVTGDKITVKLVITSENDLQYVYLKDLRAACLEPVSQLSGVKWTNSLSYYQETKNNSTDFFIDYLPKGSHTIEYSLWVNQTGTYQDGIATVQCLYAPEFISHSQAGILKIKSDSNN
jgi:uncharacterized protein YfaS (alpha-2-macroglobulin family)